MIPRLFSLVTLIIGSFLLAACASTSLSGSAKSDGLKVGYDEFQKILGPRSVTYLEGQNAFLSVLAMPGDKHPAIYRYDIGRKKFEKIYDHGQSISALGQDRTGKRIYALIDGKGDENFGIYTFDPIKKAVAALFVKPGFKSYPFDTDAKGEFLFIGSNFENKAVYSIYRLELATGKVERISDGKANFSGASVALSGEKLIATRSLSNNENEVYLLDVKAKSARLLFNRKNSIFWPGFFSDDETSLYGTSNFGKDRSGCAQLAFNKPNRLKYLLSSDSKDIYCDYNEWSKLYQVSEVARGKSTLKLYKKMFSDEVAITQVFNNQSVMALATDRTTRKMILNFSAANSPGTYYTLDLDSGRAEHLLDLNLSKIKPEQMATSYDVDYKSFDGLPIHGVIYAKPEWLKSGKKYPLIVWPHGGPDAYESHDYRGIFQFLALNDFVVFAPNFRGSGGYGKRFETLNDKDWGGGHIKDVLVGKEEVVKLPYVDPQNVFILGGSFGGYSTLTAITLYPPTFKAAVGIVAIGNLFTFLKSIPPDEAWQTEFRREMGDPVKDKALYEARSPFFHVDKLATPLQIYQAENDVRTVKAEMDLFVERLRALNKPVDYTVLKDVGHGLETPESRKLVYEGAVKFFKKSM